MPRLALKLEYRGTNFHGSQDQVGVRTVQRDLESAVGTFLRLPERKAKIIFSGRTDTGVHSRGQVVHFDHPEPVDTLDLWRFCWGINGILKDDIAITRAQVVPDDFHARFSAIKRTYAYRILNQAQRSALLRDDHTFVSHTLDVESMQAAAVALIGLHDFVAFKSTNGDLGTTMCRLDRAEILNLGEGRLEFWISANHFVYNMVRIIVGTLIEIGLGKRPINALGLALSGRQRQDAGPTAPSKGLCLESVEYPTTMQLFQEISSRD